MPHGAPDFWGYTPKETTYALADMAELAARLGSIVTFDRRGDVIFMENFDQGLSSWQVTATGEGAIIVPTTSPTMRGGMAIVMSPPPVDAGLAEIIHFMPYPTLGGIGLESCVQMAQYLGNYEMYLVLNDGIKQYQYGTIYDHINGRVNVRHSDGIFHVVGSPGVQAEGYGKFQVIKMVVDILNGNYKRIIFNDHTYDASAYTPYIVNDTSSRMMSVIILTQVSGNNRTYPVVDDVIVTQNEPL